MNPQNFNKWLEIEDGELVTFAELAHRMAIALHPNDDEGLAYGCARINLEKELPEAVWTGELVVRNALTRGVHDFPLGDALQRAVLMPHDLRPFLESRGIGLRLMPPVSPADVLPTLRRPIADEIQEHLHKSFSELPLALAERVNQAFKGVLLDPRDAELIWNEITPEQRNHAAIAADESAVHMAQVSRYAEEKRIAGRYTLEDAAKLIAESGETSEAQMLAKLETAARNHTLPTYLPGHNSKTEYGHGPGQTRTVSTFYDECYWGDLNKWLDVNDKRLTFRFSAPLAAPAKTSATGVTRHKLRTNSLDAPIKKAIEIAQTLNTAAVFVQLRELALNGEVPFTGALEKGALCYTNDDNELAKLTKDALGKRLKNHTL